MIAPALRLVAAVRGGAHLTYRPGSRVLHVYRGPLTRSGRWVPRAGRTVCGARTRQLSVLERASLALDSGDRRVCLRCEAAMPDAMGRAVTVDVGSRDAMKAAYDGLTPALLRWAGARCLTSSESHQIGRVASIVLGEKPANAPALRSAAQAELAAMWDEIYAHRRHLVDAERTPDERAARDHVKQARRDLEQRIAAQRSKDAQRNRALDRRSRSQYLTPHERELLASA